MTAGTCRPTWLGQTKALVALATVVGLAVSGCSSSVPPLDGEFGTGPAGAPATAPPAAAPSMPPVAWKPCDTATLEGQGAPPDTRAFDFSCGTIKVPRDWKNQTGPTFDLALMRARSKTQGARIGSLVFNPGGPGASGLSRVSSTASELASSLTNRFDVVGFDPRGVGRSSPVQCIPATLKDQIFSATPTPATPAEFDQQVTLQKQVASTCQRTYGETLGLYSTEQTAWDLDAIRSAVGDKKLTYLGYSYGTLLGAVYAHLFPKNIRAFVLDGAVDPTLTSTEAAHSQAAGFEMAFNNFDTSCRALGAGCPIAADPRGSVTNLLTTLKAHPMTTTDNRRLTDGMALLGVTQALYSEQYWPQLAAGVSEASAGSPDRLIRLADLYAGRRDNGTYNNQVDANSTINCDDERDTPTLAEIRTVRESWSAQFPLMGSSLAMTLIGCSVWAAKRDPYPVGSATGAPPIVVVGTAGDPATPYGNTAKLAKLLGTGTVVTWQGEGHTAYPHTPCVVSAVDRYLLTEAAPNNGTTCPG